MSTLCTIVIQLKEVLESNFHYLIYQWGKSSLYSWCCCRLSPLKTHDTLDWCVFCKLKRTYTTLTDSIKCNESTSMTALIFNFYSLLFLWLEFYYWRFHFSGALNLVMTTIPEDESCGREWRSSVRSSWHFLCCISPQEMWHHETNLHPKRETEKGIKQDVFNQGH